MTLESFSGTVPGTDRWQNPPFFVVRSCVQRIHTHTQREAQLGNVTDNVVVEF